MSEELKIQQPYGKGIVPERWVDRYGACSVSTSSYALTACVVMEQLQEAEQKLDAALAMLRRLNYTEVGWAYNVCIMCRRTPCAPGCELAKLLREDGK